MDEVSWGILGTAGIADKVGRAISTARGARLAAMASRDRGKAEAWAADRGVPTAFGSYEALLEEASIDAVYIPLPPSLHMEWTVKAAEKGKHVLCEKPLALDVKQAVIMRDACRNNGVQLMDGVMWVHHLRTIAMKQEIEEGQVGDLQRVTSAFTVNLAPENRTDNIRMQKELGGGCLGDLGYYSVRAILWAFGVMPDAVYATVRYHNGVDMNVSALLWFADDHMAAFDCGFDTYFRQWFEIVGTEGSIVCDDFVVGAEDDARYWLHRNRAAETITGEPCLQEVLMIEEFSTVVRTGDLRSTWPDEALETTTVCDAIRRSWSIGKKVDLTA